MKSRYRCCRRAVLLLAFWVATFADLPVTSAGDGFSLSTFSADVTPPLGHPLMGGGIKPAERVVDPLFAKGWVFQKRNERPLVFVSVDWCEIRSEAYERWREVLADQAQTEPARVLVTSVHVHDAPIADLAAQRLLEAQGAKGRICDLEFHEQAVQRVGKALADSLRNAQRVTHYSVNQTRVQNVASNRRFQLPDGSIRHGRTSSTRDPAAHVAGVGTVDPNLKTLTFWDVEKPVASTHFFAVHPMSYYGGGGVSADFVGMARARMQQENPNTFQIYVSGCSGNVTAGKFNDGSPTNRSVLADRVYRAMRQNMTETRRHSLRAVAFRSEPLVFEPRSGGEFEIERLVTALGDSSKPFGQCLAAMALSWLDRSARSREITVPMIDFGKARLLLLPAESYVEFQLFAQSLRPDLRILVAGYGECAPGYIPIERAWDEHDGNLADWCWVEPGSQARMEVVIRKLLRP